MIFKQKAFQKFVQRMKLKENQGGKSATSVYRARMHNKSSVCMGRNSQMPKPLGHRAIDITHRYPLISTELVQYKWTGQVGCVKTTTRIFVKLQKYAFLKQNNFMRIDELPHHSSLFYKLNFV